jgi:choline dehydrogenase
VLPFFKRLETFHDSSKSIDKNTRGTSGPVHIGPPANPLAGAKLFVEAAKEMGFR